MINFLTAALGGIIPCVLFYLIIARPLQRRIDILQKLLSIAIAQREAALSGKDRAHIQWLYRDGLKHFGLTDPALRGVPSDDVLSGRKAGPVITEEG